MAIHDVSFSIPERALGKADVTFVVKQNGAVLGTLAVSNGSVVWFPKGTTYGCKMSWSKFDRTMQDEATRVEAR
jgi:hypothetical protein